FVSQLSLSYDSGAGNGPFGFGWSLSLPSITRKTDKGLPKYQDAAEHDVFILSGAKTLFPIRKRCRGNWTITAGNQCIYDKPVNQLPDRSSTCRSRDRRPRPL